MSQEFELTRITEGIHSLFKRHFLWLIPLIVVIAKSIYLLTSGDGGWLGADGENYLRGVKAIKADGLSADEGTLSYWPAGYPILIWIFTKVTFSSGYTVITLIQSAFYGFSSYYFIKQVRDTKLQNFLPLVSLLLAFNPTLSLSSMTIGYESPIAACMLMVIALIVKAELNKGDRDLWPKAIAVALFLALASFMQPRWILTSIAIAVMWALIHRESKRLFIGILATLFIITSIAPAILIARNISAGKGAVVSTNLGVTMSLGAGPKTTGSYVHTGPKVECASDKTSSNVSDSELVKCVSLWYLHNPVTAIKLFIYKGHYFWSPWSGPLMNGTMARNPWLLINPLDSIARSSGNGSELIFGTFGNLVSWIWEFGGISLMFIGFFWLRSFKGIYAQLANFAFVPIVISWLVSMGTIGDHRFRLPIMSLSLFLQALGFYALKKKVETGSFSVAEV